MYDPALSFSIRRVLEQNDQRGKSLIFHLNPGIKHTPSSDSQHSLDNMNQGLSNNELRKVRNLSGKDYDRLLEDVSVGLEREKRAFRAMKDKFTKEDMGRYVAIYGGQIVDSDTDMTLLVRRVREEYGPKPVLVEQITNDPEPVYRITYRRIIE